jgi:hypothetical protein
MNKGFVILAQNTTTTNYVECAETLAISLKKVMPNVSVSIITNDVANFNYFDNIIPLPYNDLAPDSDWKLINDWQVYEASPYEYTIKLEADMYIPSDIEFWFDILHQRDICVCNTIRDFKGQISDVLVYRKFIIDNQLPNVYNAITYFKKSDNARLFFSIVRDVFENWERYTNTLICNKDELATTDWAYSIACHIMGEEITTIPNLPQFSMVHMKQWINNTISEDWTKELVYECTDQLKIQTFPQRYPIHYHVKDFAKTLRVHYG